MSEPLDDRAFRGALGRYGSGVTVMTTVADGEDHAITVSAFTSVSLDPPLVLACIDKTARFHEAVLSSGRWAVSILNEEGQDAATWFALRGRPLDGQLEKVIYRRGEYTGAGLLGDANAWLECRTWRTYDGGDHTIVVGEVMTAEVDDRVDDPLLYYRSHYAALLHSQASEKSPVALRSSIIEDGTAQSGA
ncbi:MAG TPA: flavin reductase family protein [Nocardioidaceae bacterium]|nr:flavin reductase family protein [Nocardioidaceae bacterium]